MTTTEATTSFKERLYVVIFEHDTRGGSAFDVALLIAVLASVLVVVLESVAQVHTVAGSWLRAGEWVFTVLFTVEYVLRLYCARRRLRYALSFFGVVDLVAILPTYASILFPGAQSLLVIRVLRLLRMFRVLKLGTFYGEADSLWAALRRSFPKVVVFLGAVLSIVVIVGTGMHLLEGPEHGFTNIPISMYWAIVTLTTVGYGDISPTTPAGRALASLLMILGYGIIAVPTGIVSAEMVRGRPRKAGPEEEAPAPGGCHACGLGEPREDAKFCRGCGAELKPERAPPDDA